MTYLIRVISTILFHTIACLIFLLKPFCLFYANRYGTIQQTVVC